MTCRRLSRMPTPTAYNRNKPESPVLQDKTDSELIMFRKNLLAGFDCPKSRRYDKSVSLRKYSSCIDQQKLLESEMPWIQIAEKAGMN
jgi:hypothetical protein